MTYELLKQIDRLIKASPEMQRKLHLLGYDNLEFVERKLQEMERREASEFSGMVEAGGEA